VDVRVDCCCCCSANILFDEQSFTSQGLADQSNIRSQRSVTTAISSFGGTSTVTSSQYTNIELITTAGDKISLSVLVVPKIATLLKIPSLSCQSIQSLLYSQERDLAHAITHTSDFEITPLIGADIYWSLVQDQIIRGNGSPVETWLSTVWPYTIT